MAGILGYLAGGRAHRREAFSDASHVFKHAPHLWLIAALPILLLAYHITFILKPAWEWSLPFAMQYYYAPAAWAILIGTFTYLAGFASSVFLATRHPRRFHLLAAMLLMCVAIEQFQWRSAEYRPPKMGAPRTSEDGFVFQTSPDTCVPAAAASLLDALGRHYSEADMVRRLGTETDGTLPSQLVMGMRRLGFRESTVDFDRDGVGAIKTPAVVFLRHNSHAVTLLRYDGKLGLIWDPIRGPVIMPNAGLHLYLRGAHALHFEIDTPAAETHHGQ